jgi:hypothetical protein
VSIIATDGLAAPLPPDRPKSGLNFIVASTMKDVLDAWQLVYHAYCDGGLIAPNPYGIHTPLEAVGPHSVVILGCLGPVPVNTVSAYTDSPGGLPLDSVYRQQLTSLRKLNRRLVEVGLFADRRETNDFSAAGMFELMRYAFYYAVHSSADDIVIGVHPRHAAFYRRLFAFERFGDICNYPTVNNNPVVLLRLDIVRKIKLSPLPKGLGYFHDHPVSAEAYAQRFRFDPETVRTSPLDGLLSYKRVRAAG